MVGRFEREVVRVPQAQSGWIGVVVLLKCLLPFPIEMAESLKVVVSRWGFELVSPWVCSLGDLSSVIGPSAA